MKRLGKFLAAAAVVSGLSTFRASAVDVGYECLENGTFETCVGVTTYAAYSEGVAYAWPWVGGGITKSGQPWTTGSNLPIGTYCAYLQGNGSLYQDFTAPTNGTYELSFVSARRVQTISGHVINVVFDVGVTNLSVTSDNANYKTNTVQVWLPAGEHRLNFHGYNASGDQSSIIDNVSLKLEWMDTWSVEPTLVEDVLYYTGDALSPVFSTTTNLVFSGDTSATQPGTYMITVTPAEGFTWQDATTDAKTFPWTLIPAVNRWTTVPAVTKTRYRAGDVVTVTDGVPAFGTSVVTLDGAAFSGTLPQTPGEYLLAFSVAAGGTHTALYYAFNLTVSAADADIGASALPTGYTKMSYLSSGSTFNASTAVDGGAYIQLDFPLQSTDRIKSKVKILDVSNNGTIFCSRIDSTTEGLSYTLFRIGTTWRMDYRVTGTAAGTVAANATYEIDVNAGSLYLNGSPDPLVAYAPDDFTAGGNMLLFASKTGTADPSNFSKMMIYHFYVYDGTGTLTHELVPAKRDADGVVGLYDLKTDTFWGHSGARAFNAVVYEGTFLNMLATSESRVTGSPYATGGDIIFYDGDTYCHLFTNTSVTAEMSFLTTMTYVDMLVVGGGGGGGNRGGGGGAGGYIEETGTTVEEGIYTITVPVAVAGLVYDGEIKTGVPEGTGYTITGNTGVLGGGYTAVATLEEGFEWADGSTAPVEINWTIGPAANAWTTVPAIATKLYGVTQSETIGLTAGVPKYGEVVATLNGEPFSGTLPNTVGHYALTYATVDDPSWTQLEQTLSFDVYPYEIHGWGSPFIGDLTTNANRIVAGEFASGEDIVLKYPGTDGARDVYIHVFTNTATASTFRVAPGKVLSDAKVLIVGGGGGAGAGTHNGWIFYCAGGGDGGDVLEVTPESGISRRHTVVVGAGGAAQGSTSVIGHTGQSSSFGDYLAAGGEGGLSNGSDVNGTERTGLGGGGQSSGGITATQHGLDGTASELLGFSQYFGGGGAGGTHSVNGGGTYTANGGRGGGGASSSDTYNAAKRYSYAGVNGLGGGGAGGWMAGGTADGAGRRGGDGIVIIRYSKVFNNGFILIIR